MEHQLDHPLWCRSTKFIENHQLAMEIGPREREKMKNEKHIKNNDDTKRFYSLLLYSERVFPSQKKKFRWNMKKMCAAFYFTRGSFFLLMQYFLRAVSCSNFNTTTSPREMYQDRREFRTFRCFWLLHAKSLMIVDRVAKNGMGTMGDNFCLKFMERLFNLIEDKEAL